MKELSSAEYIAALARQLSKLAKDANRPFLAYLLALVTAEADVSTTRPASGSGGKLHSPEMSD